MSKPRGASAYPTVSRWNVVFVSGCNLRCGYCTTGYGRFGSSGGVMDEETCERLADWIAGSMKPSPREALVGFAGGETFLHFDRFLAFVDRLPERCREQGGTARISVVTNGVLLDAERIEQLVERKIGLAFSIDGAQTVHDTYRKDTNGEGSFQAAFRNWKLCRDMEIARYGRAQCSVHSVFGPHSRSVREVSEFWIEQDQPLVRLAMLNEPRFTQDMDRETVNHACRSCVEGLREWALEQAKRCTPEDFLENYRGPFVIYKGWMRMLFDKGLPLCKPGRELLACDHRGNLFPCEAYLGTAERQIGDLRNGIDADRLESFVAECHQAERICAACPAEPTCDKPCLGHTATLSPAENISQGCELSKTLTGLVQESFEVLMQNKGRQCSD